jgi:hypothetical protein
VAQSEFDRYRGMFEASKQNHFKQIRKLKGDVRKEESFLEEPDWAVLGMTGSLNEALKYRELAKKIGEQVGKPLIVVKEVGKDKIIEAAGGIIGGAVGVKANPMVSIVKLEVPVKAQAWVNSSRVWSLENEEIESPLEIAEFHTRHTEDPNIDPTLDSYNKIPIERVLVGRRAIMKSELFGQGLDDILLGIEEERGVSRPRRLF